MLEPNVPFMFQRLRARNDINGNPRRCFVVMDGRGAILDVIDEGYGGWPRECRGLIELPEINVSAKEYASFLKFKGRLYRQAYRQAKGTLKCTRSI